MADKLCKHDWIWLVFWEIQSGSDTVHSRTDIRMDGWTDRQTDKVNQYTPKQLCWSGVIIIIVIIIIIIIITIIIISACSFERATSFNPWAMGYVRLFDECSSDFHNLDERPLTQMNCRVIFIMCALSLLVIQRTQHTRTCICGKNTRTYSFDFPIKRKYRRVLGQYLAHNAELYYSLWA